MSRDDPNQRTIEAILRALNPADEGGPSYRVHATAVTRRSFATGEAAAHIGEFPTHTVYEIRVVAQALGMNAELVGTLSGHGLTEFTPTTNTALRFSVDYVIEALSGTEPSATYKLRIPR